MIAPNREAAEGLLKIAANEAWRIEQKYSRYREDGILPKMNQSNGHPIALDSETAGLLDYAYQIYELSDGLFDITSGILRKAWSFDSEKTFPTQEEVAELLPFIGLEKANWKAPLFSLPAGMQIDFGGIGKEYAADRSLALLKDQLDTSIMINYGGDICCYQKANTKQVWNIGIENSNEILKLSNGGLATSGTTHRYLIHEGKRFSHVLNPRTGWPIENAPLSITVASENCTQAGMIATLAMLQGQGAEDFLEAQNVFNRVIR